MNIAIYTIALNEEANAQRFMDAHKDADMIAIGDTGSTDKTVDIIKGNNGSVVPLQVKPWRFDVPRNAMLTVLPANVDLCIAVDMDEFLRPGWRDIIENNWVPGTHNRIRFHYVHHFNKDGSEGTVGFKDFMHERTNYLWRHRVHEKLYYEGPGAEQVISLPDIVVEHRQDPNKSRSSYYELMELECADPSTTPQHVFWFARECYDRRKYKKAITWFEKFLSYPDTWYVERAHAHRLIGRSYNQLRQGEEAKKHLWEAMQIAPKEREMWLEIAWYHAAANHHLAYYACLETLKITQRPEHYLTTQDAWGYKVYDLAGRLAWELGMKKEAKEHLKKALQIAPDVSHVKKTAHSMGVK